MFRHLVLGLLRTGGTYHGYALAKRYRERSGMKVRSGSFYRELQRLVAEGLVRTARNPPGADPRRAPYEITEAGCVAFDTWLSNPADLWNGNHEDGLSCRALFLPEADPSLVSKLFERWEEELWIRGKVLEREREAARADGGIGAQRSFSALLLLLTRRLKHVAADLEFLAEFRSAYEEHVVQRGVARRPLPAAMPPRRRAPPRTLGPTRTQAR